MIQGKYKLELNYPGDGSLFLNFWDWRHGNDVVAEINNGRLFIDEREVSIAEFIALVENSISTPD